MRTGQLQNSPSVDVLNHNIVDSTLAVFSRFDTHHSGTIDLSELGLLLRTLDDSWDQKSVETLFKCMDTNQDSQIQFEEFLRWVFGSGQDEEHLAFRDQFGLDEQISGVVNIEVLSENGDLVFGPEEFLGTFSVGHLRRRLRADTGGLVGCLRVGSCFMRDNRVIGVYCTGHDECTQLTILDDALTQLTEQCTRELRLHSALCEFGGQPCIRVGSGKHTQSSNQESAPGDGEEAVEIMLTADGRILVKEYCYFGFIVPKSKEFDRSWRYEIAEGSYNILDPAMCFIEITWRRWAARAGRHCDKSYTVENGFVVATDNGELDPWEAKDIDAINQPHHLVPSSGGRANILNVVSEWLKDYKRDPKTGDRAVDDEGRGPGDDPLAGLPMPGISEEVLEDLEMDAVHAPYWSHGAKPAGPF